MFKKIFLTFLSLGFTYLTLAQSDDSELFYFRAIEDKISPEVLSGVPVSSHFFGDAIAKKLEVLRQDYVRVLPGTALQPAPSSVVDKPAIYYSVKKLEKYYKKAVKKGEIVKNEAAKELEDVIDIAIFIRKQSTGKLELELDRLNDVSQIKSIYSERVEITL